MALKDIVEVNITRQTTSVAVAAFNVPLILSTFDVISGKFTGRTKSYGSMKEIAEDFDEDDAVYLMANAIFSQNPSVSRVVVGRRAPASGGSQETISETMTAIQNEDNSWYGLLADQAMSTSFSDIAAWALSNKKFMILWTTDSSATIAGTLKSNNNERTAVIYHPMPTKMVEDVETNDPDYPDAAWMGEGFPFSPGSSTYAYKTLKGVKTDNITPSQETTLKGKNCNWYSEVGGVSVTQEGKVASGEWIDIIIGTDWIEARLREAVYSALVNNRKLPYDDRGIAIVVGLVKGVLSEAAKAGILQEDSIVVTAPNYADIPQAKKIARELPDVNFTALYQGAIHRTAINGTISV